MPSQKQDYLLRLIEELGRLIAELRKLRDQGRHDTALLTGLQAQERLFARPAQEFMVRPVEEQLHLLAVGETDANARVKCLAYATLLTEAGQTYAAREQAALASGAYQLALQVLLLTASDHPAQEPAEDRGRVGMLLELLSDDQLAGEVAEMLRQFQCAAIESQPPGPIAGSSVPPPATSGPKIP